MNVLVERRVLLSFLDPAKYVGTSADRMNVLFRGLTNDGRQAYGWELTYGPVSTYSVTIN